MSVCTCRVNKLANYSEIQVVCLYIFVILHYGLFMSAIYKNLVYHYVCKQHYELELELPSQELGIIRRVIL